MCCGRQAAGRGGVQHCSAHHGSQLRAEVVEEVKVELESEVVEEDGPP